MFRRSLEQLDPLQPSAITKSLHPIDTSLATIAQVAGRRWCIEECFKLAKSQLGLADYEVRSWTNWHRHMTLVLAAQVFLTVLRAQVEPMIEDSERSSPLWLERVLWLCWQCSEDSHQVKLVGDAAY